MVSYKALLAALVGLGLAGSAQAAVVATLSDFEPGSFQGWQGVNGWFGYGGNPVSAVTNATAGAPASITGSTQVMQVTINGQYWGQITAQSWANPAMTIPNYTASDALELDLYLPAAFTWPTLSINLSANISGPTVTPDLTKVGQWQHVVVPLGTISKTALAGETQLWLNTGWGSGAPFTPQTVYLDNLILTAVPEPAVLSMLFLVGGALAMRRRHA